MGRATTAHALGLALALHVALAALLPARPTQSSPPLAADDELATVTLEMDPERALPAPEPVREQEPEADPARMAALSVRRTAEDRATPAERIDAAEVAKESSPNAQQQPQEGTWTFPTTRVDLGMGERTGALARANGIGPPREPDGRSGDGPLLLSLDSIDAAQGRARSGPLREAVDEVARRAEAPTEGVAVFEITVGPKQPARARLIDASSEYGRWSGLTDALDTAARKKTLRFPPNGQALRVVVRVEAAMRLVDGRREKDLGVKATTTGLALRENVAAGESKVELPSASLRLDGKVCSLKLTAGLMTSPISGGCSPEAIGTRASRRVKTTLVSEERVSLADESPK